MTDPVVLQFYVRQCLVAPVACCARYSFLNLFTLYNKALQNLENMLFPQRNTWQKLGHPRVLWLLDRGKKKIRERDRACVFISRSRPLVWPTYWRGALTCQQPAGWSHQSPAEERPSNQADSLARWCTGEGSSWATCTQHIYSKCSTEKHQILVMY